MTSFWNTALPEASRFRFHFPYLQISAMIAKKRAEQTDEILVGWFRDEFGGECPKAAEDIVTVATARGYSVVRVVPATGDTETLALQLHGKTIRSIGVRRPF